MTKRVNFATRATLKHAPKAVRPQTVRSLMTALLSMTSLLAFTSCQAGTTLNSELQTARNNLQSSLQKIGAITGPGTSALSSEQDENGSPPITQTPLYHLFTNHQYDTQAPFNNQYPRVALKVLALPPNPTLIWGMYQLQGGAPPNQCTTFSAKIWYSPRSSRDISDFQECFPGSHPQYQGIPLRGLGDWAGQTGYYLAEEQSTGNVRTAGPIPPDHPFPQGPEYQALYGNVDVDSQNVFGATMALVFLDMGFDWSVAQDRRVWVESIPPMAQ